ncbi:MAG: signal recognition particle-docking protein FtsY [Candidatus Aminicenantes bacterium]|nr:signal recognition particle-docking protein FtsY [Candidatus Aminicenantes bacterium]
MLSNLKEKLSRTRNTFKNKFDDLLKSQKDREGILTELEESLILADVGVGTTGKIITAIREKSKKSDTFTTICDLLKGEIERSLSQFPLDMNLCQSRSVVMLVGINGGGKTTSLAKLAYFYKNQGKNCLLVAGDTFRAAAQEQLSLWGKKLNIPVIKGQYMADPASVVFDSIQSFKSHDYQMLLIDTAGRVHTNVNLMNELEKIKRIISRELEGAPHEVLLVLDASIGQNALIQAREFLKFSGISGIFLTKLDGTAKGGSVLSIIDELELPIKFIGIGEEEKDMLFFSPKDYTNALLS